MGLAVSRACPSGGRGGWRLVCQLAFFCGHDRSRPTRMSLPALQLRPVVTVCIHAACANADVRKWNLGRSAVPIPETNLTLKKQ